MGMTILQAKQRLHEKWMQLTKDGTDEEMMQALSIGDTILGNYDENLKANMVALLTEIQSEIEEIETYENTFGSELRPKKADEIQKECLDLIQQKIDELKGLTK